MPSASCCGCLARYGQSLGNRETLLARCGAAGPRLRVLGYDTARSTDHHWGPRVLLFLRPADAHRHGHEITETLAERMPASVRGWSTNFSPPGPGQSR